MNIFFVFRDVVFSTASATKLPFQCQYFLFIRCHLFFVDAMAKGADLLLLRCAIGQTKCKRLKIGHLFRYEDLDKLGGL